MAEEIRIIRGDSEVLSFAAIDKDTKLPLDLDPYEAMFITENFTKTTILTPLEIRKDLDESGNPVILVMIKPSESDPCQSFIHYELKIYKLSDPNVVTTGSTGDLKFINE